MSFLSLVLNSSITENSSHRPSPTGSDAASTPQYLPTPVTSSPASLSGDDFLPPDHRLLPALRIREIVHPSAMESRNSSSVARSTARAGDKTIRFPPFDDLSAAALHQANRFGVESAGKVANNKRHVPYESDKKNFFAKTGRTGFETFYYSFRLPGDEQKYTVMWDYEIGLVRMTPFFKCDKKYQKTSPVKMLAANPGLKEICFSITGGSIPAQGYWMPYDCARAVCATFCYRIAGALIPIFGPSFPNDCVPLNHTEPANMRIDENIVARSAREAEMFRDIYMAQCVVSKSGGQVSDTNPTRVATINANADAERFRQPTGTHANQYNGLTGSSTWTRHQNGGWPHTPARVERTKTSTPPSVSNTGRGWTAINQVLPPIASITRSFQHTSEATMHDDKPAADPWRSAVPTAGSIRQCQRQERTPLPGLDIQSRHHHAASSNSASRISRTHPHSSDTPVRNRDAHQTRVKLTKTQIHNPEATGTKNVPGRDEPAAPDGGNQTPSQALTHRSRLALEQHAAAALLIGLSESTMHESIGESAPGAVVKPATQAEMAHKATNGDDEGNHGREQATAHASLDADEHRSKRRRTCSI